MQLKAPTGEGLHDFEHDRSSKRAEGRPQNGAAAHRLSHAEHKGQETDCEGVLKPLGKRHPPGQLHRRETSDRHRHERQRA